MIRVGVGHDGTITIGQNLFRQAHKEDRRDDAYSGLRLDQLQGRTDGISGRVDSAGDKTVGLIERKHHCAEDNVVCQLVCGRLKG